MNEFVQKCFRFCDENRLFIPFAKRPVGGDTAFSFDLNDGSAALSGLGVVLEEHVTNDNRYGRPGVVIEIRHLQPASQPVFDEMTSMQDKPRAPTPTPATPTPTPTPATPTPMLAPIPSYPRAVTSVIEIPVQVAKQTTKCTMNMIAVPKSIPRAESSSRMRKAMTIPPKLANGSGALAQSNVNAAVASEIVHEVSRKIDRARLDPSTLVAKPASANGRAATERGVAKSSAKASASQTATNNEKPIIRSFHELAAALETPTDTKQLASTDVAVIAATRVAIAAPTIVVAQTDNKQLAPTNVAVLEATRVAIAAPTIVVAPTYVAAAATSERLCAPPEPEPAITVAPSATHRAVAAEQTRVVASSPDPVAPSEPSLLARRWRRWLLAGVVIVGAVLVIAFAFSSKTHAPAAPPSPPVIAVEPPAAKPEPPPPAEEVKQPVATKKVKRAVVKKRKKAACSSLDCL